MTIEKDNQVPLRQHPLFRWGMRGGLAVLDQALFSGSNFVLSVLLARWQTPAEYGAYSVTFSIFLFLSGFHNALILEPMSIFGMAHYADQLGAYFKHQVRLHLFLSMGLSSFTLLAALLMRGMGWALPLVSALWGVALALPFMLFVWLARRAFYMIQKPLGAVAASFIYAVVLFLSFWWFARQKPLTSFEAYLLLGLASLIGCLPLYFWRQYLWVNTAALPFRPVLRAHWDFGKWITGASILSVATSQAQTFLTAGLIGLEAAGVLRAITNFSLPMMQVITAISIMGQPVLAFEYGQGRLFNLKKKGWLITGVLTGIALVYELGLLWLAGPLERLLYGGKYAQYAPLIPVIGLVPVFSALFTGLALVIRSLQKPQFYLVSGVVGVMVGIFSGWLLTLWFGLGGAIWSTVLSYAALLISTIYLYFLWVPLPTELS